MKMLFVGTLAAAWFSATPASQTARPDDHLPACPKAEAAPLDAQFPAESILGEWWTEGKEGRMKFVKTKSGKYEAIVVANKEPNKKDTNNPDPKLRERKIIGVTLIWHLTYSDGEYEDGYVYNPRDGKTYRFTAKMESANTLKIRGYLAIPLLGQSQIWTRAR